MSDEVSETFVPAPVLFRDQNWPKSLVEPWMKQQKETIYEYPLNTFSGLSRCALNKQIYHDKIVLKGHPHWMLNNWLKWSSSFEQLDRNIWKFFWFSCLNSSETELKKFTRDFQRFPWRIQYLDTFKGPSSLFALIARASVCKEIECHGMMENLLW